jgi:DNA-binding GntR family transcriptional regulator
VIAIEQIDERDLQSLQDLVNKMSDCIKTGDTTTLVEIDLTFHETLCRMTGNQRLLDAWKSQIIQLRMLLALSGSAGYDVRNMVKGHQQIIVALRDGDLKEARMILNEHICRSMDRLLRQREDENQQ